MDEVFIWSIAGAVSGLFLVVLIWAFIERRERQRRERRRARRAAAQQRIERGEME